MKSTESGGTFVAKVADIIIFGREELKKLAGDYAKLKQISNVVIPKDGDEVVDALGRFPKAVLVLDWDVGPPNATKILGANRRGPEGGLRPILLVCGKVSAEVVTTAAEYGVSQILSGDQLEAKTFAAKLGPLALLDTFSDDFTRTLKEIRKYREKGDHDKAIAPLEALRRKKPDDLRITAELAASLLQVDRWEEAKKLLQGIATRQPPFLRGIHLYGRCLMREGLFREAEEVLGKASLFNPHDADRLIDLGHCLLEMDRIKEAGQKFDEALAIEPDLRQAREGKGKTLLLEGQVNDALAILKESTTPRELASIFNISAVMNMRQGRFQEGMQLYVSAVKALGGNQKIHARLLFNMGLGFRRWKKPGKALECFEQALSFDPKYAKAKEHMDVVQNSQKTKGDVRPPSEAEIHSVLDQAEGAKSAGADELGFDADFGKDFEDFEDDFGEDFAEEDLDFGDVGGGDDDSEDELDDDLEEKIDIT